MKNITKKMLGIAVAMAFVLPLAAHAEESEAPLVIPDTIAEIHQAVNNEMAEMDKMILAGEVKGLHQRAFAVRDLIAALPEKSASLAEDKLATIKSNGKFVATLADRLDTAGDSNDKAAAAESFGKLKGVVDSVWANYPDAASPTQE